MAFYLESNTADLDMNLIYFDSSTRVLSFDNLVKQENLSFRYFAKYSSVDYYSAAYEIGVQIIIAEKVVNQYIQGPKFQQNFPDLQLEAGKKVILDIPSIETLPESHECTYEIRNRLPEFVEWD